MAKQQVIALPPPIDQAVVEVEDQRSRAKRWCDPSPSKGQDLTAH
jgi:hypothetical protein